MVGNMVGVGGPTIRSGCLPITASADHVHLTDDGYKAMAASLLKEDINKPTCPEGKRFEQGSLSPAYGNLEWVH